MILIGLGIRFIENHSATMLHYLQVGLPREAADNSLATLEAESFSMHLAAKKRIVVSELLARNFGKTFFE